MNLGACLNCKNHEECTFQRTFPVMECDEYDELDLTREQGMSLKDILKEWGFSDSRNSP